MTPALIMWAVVFCIGVPSGWRNPTAAALVIAKIAGWGWYQISGDNLPVDFYIFPDIMVLAVIMAKPEWCNLQPYRNVWHQLQCVLLERSHADRIVMVTFVIMWGIYVMDLHPYYKWWALYWLVIAQFLAAGWEAFSPRPCKAVSDRPETTSGDELRFAWGRGSG